MGHGDRSRIYAFRYVVGAPGPAAARSSPKAHPLGCHRQRVPDRQALNAIFFVLRTGCQWKALDATGWGKGSTAHRRFQRWAQAGVFARRWDEALQDAADLIGPRFAWLSLDGPLRKAPLGGKKRGPAPRTAAKCALSIWERRQAPPADRGAGHPRRAGAGPGLTHQTLGQ